MTHDLRELMHEVFTPGFPINHRDLFRGRSEQLRRVLDTVPSPGRHPIIYGLRGVGKTSFINVLSFFLANHHSVKVTCDSSDTFKTLWNRVLQKATVTFKEHVFGFTREESEQKSNLAAFLGTDNGVTPSDVAGVLSILINPAVFILDEFDQVGEDNIKSAVAALIKNVSDNNPNVTIVLVGVGDSVSELIGEHGSIIRNLVQVDMPVMKAPDIQEIITKGCERLQITTDSDVLDEIAFLSSGFPHYAHLLGLGMAKACVIHDVSHVDLDLFNALVCSLAVEDSIETYRQAYTKATKTAQQSRYPTILCACGVARYDENGVFRATDVVEAIESTFGEAVAIQAVVPALRAFTEGDRGQVLDKVPVGNVTHYRFREPMMRPFLRIRARTLQS